MPLCLHLAQQNDVVRLIEDDQVGARLPDRIEHLASELAVGVDVGTDLRTLASEGLRHARLDLSQRCPRDLFGRVGDPLGCTLGKDCLSETRWGHANQGSASISQAQAKRKLPARG